MTRISAIIFTAIVFFCSCVRDLDMSLGQDPLVVVECVLQDESPQTLNLFLAKAGDSTKMIPITEAEVLLIDKTSGNEAGRFINTGTREWTLDYAAVPGHEYRLEVEVPGHDSIYAEDCMPGVITILAKNVNKVFNPSLDVANYGEDFAGTVYYLVELPEYSWIYALDFNPETGKRQIAEQICTDYPWVDNFNLSGESYVPEEEDGEFMGHHYRSFSYPFLEGTAMHRRFLRLRAPSDKELEDYRKGKPETGYLMCVVSGRFSGEYHLGVLSKDEDLADNEGCVVAMSMSKNYDSYVREAMRIQQMQESSDMATVYVRDNIYSNIEGGVGIFGAAVRRFQAWKRYSNGYEIK